MVIFHSYVNVYQRVCHRASPLGSPTCHINVQWSNGPPVATWDRRHLIVPGNMTSNHIKPLWMTPISQRLGIYRYIYTESIHLLLSQKSGSMLYIHRCVSSPAPPNPSYTSDVSAPNEVYVTLLVVARAVSRKRHGLGASREMLIC